MKKISTHVLKAMKDNNDKFAVVTTYDYAFSKIVSNANIEAVSYTHLTLPTMRLV